MSDDQKSLVALVSEASEIEQRIIDSYGELTPELEQLLQVNETSLAEKVDAYDLVMGRMDSISEFYEQRASMFMALSKAADNVKKRLKENIQFAMQKLGTTELAGQDVKFKLVKSPPSVVFDDESKVPAAYKTIVQTAKIDKKRIAEDLKVGVPVEGCSLKQGESLRIFANTPNKKAVKK